MDVYMLNCRGLTDWPSRRPITY